jgi:hypothetical protein
MGLLYRLLPHIIAACFDHWSRCSTDHSVEPFSYVLAFDLRDLIDLLAPRSREASWTVSPVRLNS